VNLIIDAVAMPTGGNTGNRSTFAPIQGSASPEAPLATGHCAERR
jgi:hypothetical protein